MTLRERTVKANGLEFAYLELGAGPLVLLMHGFPDNAYTWEQQMRALADAGYRAVAPFLRGYPPTEIPERGYYDAATLAVDARELIKELNAGEPAYVVGNDWGTLITYTLGRVFPEVVRRAVVTAIPYPPAATGLLAAPDLLQHYFHVWFHQMPSLPEAAIPLNDFAYVDYLWHLWEPGFEDPDHLARVKRTLSAPGALTAALGYYRAVFDPARSDPALADITGKLGGPIDVPMLVIFGKDDPLSRFVADHEPYFTSEFRAELVEGCEHFAHRSRPAAINELILSWFAAGD